VRQRATAPPETVKSVSDRNNTDSLWAGTPSRDRQTNGAVGRDLAGRPTAASTLVLRGARGRSV
jgi:hypothetical protein